MLIKCIECGKEISSRASACPNCGCPVEDESRGNVRIKLSAQEAPFGRNYNQNVSITSGGKTLWHGSAGEVAIIYFEKPTEITVRYHMTSMFSPGECRGVINPAESKKYSVFPTAGKLVTNLEIRPVEIFDDD